MQVWLILFRICLKRIYKKIEVKFVQVKGDTNKQFQHKESICVDHKTHMLIEVFHSLYFQDRSSEFAFVK